MPKYLIPAVGPDLFSGSEFVMRGWLSLGFHVRENGGDVYLVPVRYPACLQWVPVYIPHCSGSKGGDGEVSVQLVEGRAEPAVSCGFWVAGNPLIPTPAAEA